MYYTKLFDKTISHNMFWKCVNETIYYTLVLLNNYPKCNSMIKINFDWF